jgi:hypothetical protein
MWVAVNALILGSLIILTSQIVTVATWGPVDNAKFIIYAALLQDHSALIMITALKAGRQTLQSAIFAYGASGIYVAVR